MEPTEYLIHDARRVGKVVVVFLFMNMFADGLSIVLTTLLGPGNPDSTDLTSADIAAAWMLIAQGVLILATGIAYLIWVSKSVAIVPHLKKGPFRFTPGAAVLSYFIPFVNFYRPYQVMRQTFETSSPKAKPLESEVRTLIGLWWFGWIGASFANILLMRASPELGPIVESLLSIVGAFALVKLVPRLQDIQAARAEEMRLEASPETGAYPRPPIPTY